MPEIGRSSIILGLFLVQCQAVIGHFLIPDTDIGTGQLMLYREIMAVCSEIHTKHINTLCGQSVELLNVKLVVHIVTTGL